MIFKWLLTFLIPTCLLSLPLLCISCSNEKKYPVYTGNKDMFLNINYKPKMYDELKDKIELQENYVSINIKNIINESLLRDTIYLFIWNEVVQPNNPTNKVEIHNLEYSFTNLSVTKKLDNSYYCDFLITIYYSINKNGNNVYYKSVWQSIGNANNYDAGIAAQQTLTGYSDPEFRIEQELANKNEYQNSGPGWALWSDFHNYYKQNNHN